MRVSPIHFTSTNNSMRRVSIRRLVSRFCTNKTVLLLDSPYYDSQHHWIHQKGLQKQASPLLQFDYLSLYTGNQEILQKTCSFRGTIVRPYNCLIFPIPTALYKGPSSSMTEQLRYHYVYYILDTVSPISTLTQEAFNCLKGKEQFPFADYNQGFFCKTAGITMRFYPSNTDEPVSTIPCRPLNVNILGTDFLKKYSGYKVETSFSTLQASLQLID